MKQSLHFWLFGGDLRQHWLARQLAQDGNQVHCYGLDPQLLPEDDIHLYHSLDFCQRTPCDCVLFPLPMANKHKALNAPLHPDPIPLAPLFAQLPPQVPLLGGQISQELYTLAAAQERSLLDYFKEEELTIANAVPTAEGCIQLAMERLPITIQGGEFLVLGYGQVGTATAQRLAALGAKVTVAARRYSQLAQASAQGFRTDRIQELVGGLCHYDCIVNTVPALILGEAELADISPHCLIIDLASHPGGVHLAAAEALQRQVISALSLPGRVAPASAGKAIQRTIYHMLEELPEKEGDPFASSK